MRRHAILCGWSLLALAACGGGDAPARSMEAGDTGGTTPPRGRWERLPYDLPGTRSGAAAAFVGSMLHVIGGQRGGEFLADHSALDPRTGRWSSLPPLEPGRTFTAPNAAPHAGDVYVVAGNPRGYCTNDARVSRGASARWEVLPPAPVGRCHAAVVAAGGRVHVIGGWNTASTVHYTQVDVLDPASGRWMQGVPLPAWRGGMAAGAIGDVIVIAGGTTADATFSPVTLAYDTRTGAWSTRAPLPTPRGAAAAAVLDGRLFVIGGFVLEGGRAKLLDVVESYDPASDRWRPEPPLPVPTAFAAAATSPDGEIYLVGGHTSPAAESPVGAMYVFRPR